MFYVYTIRNILDTQKVYVGKTNDPKSRWGYHKKIARGGDWAAKRRQHIHHAMRKYGIENFIFKIVDQSLDEIEAYKLESQWYKNF